MARSSFNSEPVKPLERNLRNLLERTVKTARDVAEEGAIASLQELGVGEAVAPVHLNDTKKDLRRRLRAHGRQLGDIVNAKTDVQGLDRLVEEVAYEHWHRMLFARFLAESQLLMMPQPGGAVAVTLEECNDLAKESEHRARNGWELASRFATKMLPQVFRPDSPVFEITLPPEKELKLEDLLEGLSTEVFLASDSLGWVYQFWQAKRKDDINASEEKIGARELPAVTQLFTEPYMVSFLLDNALGAWWAARYLSAEDLANAASEDELRRKASIPGVPLEYLRFAKNEKEVWEPADNGYKTWPTDLTQFKVLDPCCGSGHFLVAAFQMLVPLRMHLEGLSARDAVDKVLEHNIHGLELDPRCVELAAFALALSAWRYPAAGRFRPLPELHLACSGLTVSAATEEWKQIGLGKKNLGIALEWMHNTFKHAPVLGSLLNPSRSDAAKLVRWDELSEALAQALSQEKSEDRHEAAVVAQGMAKAAILLAGQYHLVITNVPYLARAKQCTTLRDYSEKHYSAAKNDLATVFLDRCLDYCAQGGSVSVVLPQNWLFLTTYTKFREKLLTGTSWNVVAKLGPGAFDTISGEVVKAILISLSHYQQTFGGDLLSGFGHQRKMHGLDVSEESGAVEKAVALAKAEITNVEQAQQLKNPDSRISFGNVDGDLLKEVAQGLAGILNGDSPRFLKVFWELADRKNLWSFQQTTQEKMSFFGGLHNIVFYDEVNGHLREEEWIRRERLHDSDQRGQAVVGKKGVGVSEMGSLPCAMFLGSRFDSNLAVIVPKDERTLPAIWCFCSSPEYKESVRKIDQKLNVTNATLVKVPFDLLRWTSVAVEKYPHGLPKPFSDDCTQWIFHGHPCGSVVWDETSKKASVGGKRTESTVLQVAVARLLGYRWPAELDAGMELANEQRQWVRHCDELLELADGDGIVCIPAVGGQSKAEDRLAALLRKAYGDAWSSETLQKLLDSANSPGQTLEFWLREKFFSQHFAQFHHRPFIWQVWDGTKDGFSALVNYHRLDGPNLRKLIYTHLGDWINQQKSGVEAKASGAQTRLAAAENLKVELEKILEGKPPYDIFVRWKTLGQQPLGWEPDFNDGVRLNIRPFLGAKDVGKNGAGVLRDKPNIKWDKDRGKDVSTAPWFKIFKGERINDHHLTLDEKRATRKAKGGNK